MPIPKLLYLNLTFLLCNETLCIVSRLLVSPTFFTDLGYNTNIPIHWKLDINASVIELYYNRSYCVVNIRYSKKVYFSQFLYTLNYIKPGIYVRGLLGFTDHCMKLSVLVSYWLNTLNSWKCINNTQMVNNIE